MILTINHNVPAHCLHLRDVIISVSKTLSSVSDAWPTSDSGSQTSLLYGLYVYPLAVPFLLIEKSIECWVPSPTCKTNSVGYKLLHVLYTYTNIFGYR